MLFRRNHSEPAEHDVLRADKITMGYRSRGDSPALSVRPPILHEIDLQLHRGSVIGLVGRTGVGKTTLGKILGGLLRPDSGSVTIGGLDILKCAPAVSTRLRRWIRYVPQNPDASLPRRVSVSEALQEARDLAPDRTTGEQDWWTRAVRSQLYEHDWADRSIGELSLGERRRVMNLRAFLTNPRFLILDEPFNGLHGDAKMATLDILRILSVGRRSGILVISHDAQALSRACDTVYELDGSSLRETKRTT